jgi:hypothetical protein
MHRQCARRLPPFSLEFQAMKVAITQQPGLFAEGNLKGVISEQDGPNPHIVIEMNVAGVSDPVTVTLDVLDLSTITHLAKASRIQKIRDAVR